MQDGQQYASHLPGRTDNEVKNFWNTKLKKKLIRNGYDPITHLPHHLVIALLANKEFLDHYQQCQYWDHENNAARLQQEAFQLANANIMNSCSSSTFFMDMDSDTIINHLCSFSSTKYNNSSVLSSPQFENTKAFCQGDSSLVNDSPRLLSYCSSSTSSTSNVVQPVKHNMVNNCNASTIWPELLLLEDPLFNEISKF